MKSIYHRKPKLTNVAVPRGKAADIHVAHGPGATAAVVHAAVGRVVHVVVVVGGVVHGGSGIEPSEDIVVLEDEMRGRRGRDARWRIRDARFGQGQWGLQRD